MKIGVFFSRTGRETAKKLMSVIQPIGGVELHGYQIGKNWEEVDGQEMTYHLRQFDFTLIVTGDSHRVSDLGSWVFMLIGYVMGRDGVVCMYATQPLSIQGMYKHIPVFYGEDELVSFIKEEKQIWAQDKTLLTAKQRLADLGLGLNEEALAQKVVKGERDIVQDYLTIGFSPDARDPAGSPLLVLAIRNGHDALAKSLLEWGAGVNVMSEDRGNTPLMEAAVRGSVTLMEQFISAGAELDVQSKNGQTALMLSVGEGHIPAAICLIKAGADPDISDQLGMTAKKYAALFNHQAVLEAIQG